MMMIVLVLGDHSLYYKSHKDNFYDCCDIFVCLQILFLGKNFRFFKMMPESPWTTILNLLSLVGYVLAKFEVVIRLKFYGSLSFLLFRVSDGHFFFDFSNFCPFLISMKYVIKGSQ